MSFNRPPPTDRPQTWFDEFRAEVISDHRALLERRVKREEGKKWSFDHAVRRTREFYRERLTGYQGAGSISRDQLDVLLALVERLGEPDFETVLKSFNW